MGRTKNDHMQGGLDAFRAGVETLKRIRGIETDAELWRIVSKRTPDKLSRKTVNNALQGRHDARVSTLQAIADALDCPLWVLFLTGRNESDLESPNRERLIAMMRHYLACDSEARSHIENMAAAFAARQSKPS